MPKHKHKHDKKSGSGGFHAKCAELARSTRAAFDPDCGELLTTVVHRLSIIRLCEAAIG